MQRAVDRILAGVTDEVDWGICVVRDGVALAEVESHRVLPTASVGKVLLLLEVARLLDERLLDPAARLAPLPEDVVADSGLWQHLAEPDLSVASLAVLVASVSDNLATNVLLREVGLAAVDETAGRCGLTATRMLDRVRDHRGPQDAPALSVGCAADLSGLLSGIAAGTAVSPGASARAAAWLSLGVDASMVAGGLALDPLAHLDGTVRLIHKTGWDAGVRADVGHVSGPTAHVSYAVLARWEPDAVDPSVDVLAAMHAIGELVRAEVV
jgi:beta-lactamase class A